MKRRNAKNMTEYRERVLEKLRSMGTHDYAIKCLEEKITQLCRKSGDEVNAKVGAIKEAIYTLKKDKEMK